uniref:G-protein coupled receptors family 1 profile domain-containing protein n=1 Tax=Plectus sambesii TaxID=2011161 RepID=A0A914VBL5_9BILA
MCDAACITGWATTVYSLVTIPFYVLFLCMIIYHRKTPEFNHAFFKILISLSVADIVQLIVALFFNQFLVFHGWVSNFCLNFLGDLGAHLGTLLLWGTAMAQHLNVVSMAFNRYTAYVHPLKFNQVKKEMNNSPNDKIKYQSALLALKITVCGSIIALGLIMLAVIFFCDEAYYLVTGTALPHFHIIYSVIVNMYGGINPYVFILSSRLIRNRFFEMLGINKPIGKTIHIQVM